MSVLSPIAALILTLAMSIVVVPSAAFAGPDEELQEARESFLAGEYDKAIRGFTGLLYPRSRLAAASAIAEAHLLLGVSFLETGALDGAKREFEEALFLDLDLNIDASLFSTEAVRVFGEVKTELKEKADIAAEKARIARQKQGLDDFLKNLVVYENRQYYVNFIPFGAGQFQNDQVGKGIAFFAAEALAVSTSVGLWSYQVVRYGFGGQVPRDEIDTVNTIQIAQIASGALFYILGAWGIVDSLIYYEDQIKRPSTDVSPEAIKGLLDSESRSIPIPIFLPTLLPMGDTTNSGASLIWIF